MTLPTAEQLLASAVQYLIQGGEQDAAILLLFCDAEFSSDTTEDWFKLNLTGPRMVYEALQRNGWDGGFPVGHRASVEEAFEAVTPHDISYGGFSVRVQLVDLNPNWRAELQEIAHGRGVHNQGTEIPGRSVITWKGNIKFRSEAERRVAEALDATGVFFLPNCLARLNAGSGRVTREADFLVCSEGKWGVLEVDGPFHPRAVFDHNRDRLFQAYRIRVTQRFDWEECLNDAPGVVRRFLTLLDKNG